MKTQLILLTILIGHRVFCAGGTMNGDVNDVADGQMAKQSGPLSVKCDFIPNERTTIELQTVKIGNAGVVGKPYIAQYDSYLEFNNTSLEEIAKYIQTKTGIVLKNWEQNGRFMPRASVLGKTDRYSTQKCEFKSHLRSETNTHEGEGSVVKIQEIEISQ